MSVYIHNTNKHVPIHCKYNKKYTQLYQVLTLTFAIKLEPFVYKVCNMKCLLRIKLMESPSNLSCFERRALPSFPNFYFLFFFLLLKKKMIFQLFILSYI